MHARAVLATALAGTLACGEPEPTAPDADAVASVSLAPPLDTVFPGYTAQLTATPRNAAGQVLTGKTITWSTGLPLIATVSDSGLVTGVAVGAVTIDAIVDGVTGTAGITVLPVPVLSVSVTPPTDTVLSRDTLRLTATPIGPSGEPLSGRPITWSSSAPSIATVNSSGLVTGVGGGVATITASVDGVTGTASMTVLGGVNGLWDWTEDIQSCHDTGTYAFQQNGGTFVGRSDQVGICADYGAIVRNDNIGHAVATGVISGDTISFAVGTCNYTAMVIGESPSDSLHGSVTCFGVGPGTWRAVRARPVASAMFERDTVHVVRTWPRRAILILRDTLGNRVFRPTAWSSTRPLVASVDSNGLIVGQAAGNATLIAAVEGRADTLTVDVGTPRMAFLSRHDGTPQIYTMNADGSNLVQLTQGTDWGIDSGSVIGQSVLEWSPDGTRLALAGPRISVINSSNGADWRMLWAEGRDPHWVQGGAAVRLIDSAGVWDVSPDGADTVHVATPNLLATTPSGDSGSSASRFGWSPDGSKLAFQRQSTFFFTTVFQANVDGSALRKFTPSNWAEGSPAWSPDGTKVAFFSCGYGLSVMNSDGSGPITPVFPGGCFSANGTVGIWTRSVWSPDGSYVAFARIDPGPYMQVWVVDVSGTTVPHRITPSSYDAWAPAFWR